MSEKQLFLNDKYESDRFESYGGRVAGRLAEQVEDLKDQIRRLESVDEVVRSFELDYGRCVGFLKRICSGEISDEDRGILFGEEASDEKVKEYSKRFGSAGIGFPVSKVGMVVRFGPEGMVYDEYKGITNAGDVRNVHSSAVGIPVIADKEKYGLDDIEMLSERMLAEEREFFEKSKFEYGSLLAKYDESGVEFALAEVRRFLFAVPFRESGNYKVSFVPEVRTPNGERDGSIVYSPFAFAGRGMNECDDFVPAWTSEKGRVFLKGRVGDEVWSIEDDYVAIFLFPYRRVNVGGRPTRRVNGNGYITPCNVRGETVENSRADLRHGDNLGWAWTHRRVGLMDDPVEPIEGGVPIFLIGRVVKVGGF